MKDVYSKEFYSRINAGSTKSAAIVLRIVKEQVLNFSSVVDVGAGSGAWISAACNLGCNRVQAVDGPWAAARFAAKSIPFVACDFSIESPHLTAQTRFDLATCVEMAEHISESRARVLVNFLCSQSAVILFSAASPGQGGDHHVNEQWPAYWASMFGSKEFLCVDWLRWQIWSDEQVEWWYRQNILLFVSKLALESLSDKMKAAVIEHPISVVHPRSFERFHGRGHKLARVVAGLTKKIGR